MLKGVAFLVNDNRAKVYAFVILPNHIHLLLKIHPTTTISDVQRDFMKFTSQVIKFDLEEKHPDVLNLFEVNSIDRKHQLWMRKPKNVLLY